MNLSQIVANGFHKTFTGSDVTITEAKAKACEEFLINGKAVTKRKQEALWGRYIPCDGITNGANTSIDTGIKAVNNMEMLVRVKAITGSFYILQARQSTTSNIYGFSGSQNGDKINFFDMDSGITRTVGHIYTIKGTLINGAITLYVKDETTGDEDTKTGTTSHSFPSATTIKLFGDASKLSSGCTVYRAYIKVNGQMAWDMYPASDTTTVFNSIIAYDDVTHAKSTVVSGVISGGSLIQPISYAKSDGTVFADTEIVPKTFDYTITFEGAIKKIDTGPNCVWGYMGNSSSIQIPRWMCAGYNNGYLMNANETTTIPGGDTNNHTFVCTVYDNGGTPYWSSIIDGAEKQNRILPSSSAWTTNTSSIYLFARNNVDGAGNFAPVTFKKWICEKAGVVIKHIIPVKVGTTVRLLDIVNWGFVTVTGTLTAGPDIPYGQLCPDILETNVGDVWYGSRNEFNLNTITSGKYLNSAGVETSNTLWNVSDYMPVIGGETYYQRLRMAGTSQRTCWYTANKTLISVSSQVAGGTLTAPANAAYARMSVYCLAIQYDDLTYAMFYKGVDAPEEYVPYEPVGPHPSGAQTITIGDQTRTITTLLPSATSFVDAQKASNNCSCDWKFKVLDGTESYAWGNPSVTLRWTGMETLKTGIAPVCNVLEGVASFTTGAQIVVYNSTTFRLRIPGITGSDDAKRIITDLYKAGKPMILAYPVDTPEVTTVEIAPVSLANGTNRVTASSGTVKVTANVRVI